MPDPYSPLLLLAVILTGAATVALILDLYNADTVKTRLALMLALGGDLAVSAALAGHIVLGHAPGSATGLSPMAFVRDHPAAIMILTVCAVVMVISLLRLRR